MQPPINKMIFLALFIVLITGIAISAADVKNGATIMILFGGNLGDVSFPHYRHQEALGDCNSCHNLFPQTAGAIQELNRQDKLKKKEVMNQCTKCHRDLASTDKKGGPVQCKECHQKK